MTISGFNPINALPSLASSGADNGSLPNAAQLSGNPLYGASAGAIEKPGIGTRLMSAMRSAIGELRGTGSSSFSVPMQAQTLALQAPGAGAPVSLATPAGSTKAKFPNAKTWIDKAGNVRQLGTGKVLKPAAGAAAAPSATAAASAAQAPLAGAQLPSNAAQLQGATVYSYDQNGNPVAPTMQQLGMTPTMLQGLQGLAGAADPDGPQMNATNQSNIGLGTGLGMGSAVPVLGQPILTTSPTPAPTSPGDAGAATGSTGGTQSVTNENTSDNQSRNQGLDYGYGSGSSWGGLPFGGIASPAAPYGSSMTGAYALGNSSRLF
jgi:hypothetical protein